MYIYIIDNYDKINDDAQQWNLYPIDLSDLISLRMSTGTIYLSNDETSEAGSNLGFYLLFRKRTLRIHHDLVRNLQGGTVQPRVKLTALLLEVAEHLRF